MRSFVALRCTSFHSVSHGLNVLRLCHDHIRITDDLVSNKHEAVGHPNCAHGLRSVHTMENSFGCQLYCVKHCTLLDDCRKCNELLESVLGVIVFCIYVHLICVYMICVYDFFIQRFLNRLDNDRDRTTSHSDT